MFSGIITHIGIVESAIKEGRGMRLTLQTHIADLENGESLAVNGVCLTVETRYDNGRSVFWLSPETLKCSALGRLISGADVNLERAMPANGRLSGHIVQGHVDGKAVLLEAVKEGDAHKITLFLPQTLRRYIVPKGSICLDGVSLTVNQIEDRKTCQGQNGFHLSIMLVPHTWEHTGFRNLHIFDELNVETDIIGRYVEAMLQFPPTAAE